MNWISDAAVARLRAVGSLPDLSGTKYRVLEGVGRGGMGAVYLAEDTTLGRRVALKTLDLPDPTGELTARMLREAQILARLEHPGIVPVHDVGRLADGRVFYTMKFVRGDRLDRHLGKMSSPADRLRIFQKICDAVAFAHAHGVVHRDLKPENVMVGTFGEVLVMDWGVAKVLRDPAGRGEAMSDSPQRNVPATGEAPREDGSASEHTVVAPAPTAHGAVLGTPGYMAPEQARGEVENLDARADVFALGAILRFLLTGQAPGGRL
ncbi:MAG: serine/threonine protein kinase [Acidobacteria bacterium]|nr:serine/threonine protein kinase [Acidobacteriota bacterium]